MQTIRLVSILSTFKCSYICVCIINWNRNNKYECKQIFNKQQWDVLTKYLIRSILLQTRIRYRIDYANWSLKIKCKRII